MGGVGILPTEGQFGYTEVRIGFIPAIVMVFLIRKIGETRAKELLLSGDIVDAATAEKYNMINKVVPAAEIEAHVTAFAARLCSQNSGQSMAITKKMIGDVQHFPISEALTIAARMNARARGSEDCKRGIAAFLNKENILELLLDLNQNFPAKDFDFILDQFTLDGNIVSIYGRVNEFQDIGAVQSSLEKSQKFKNIKIVNKNLISGVTKFKVRFKIELEIQTSPEKNTRKEEDNAE